MKKKVEISPDDLEDMIDSFMELEVFIFKKAEEKNLDFQTIYTNLIGMIYKLSSMQNWDLNNSIRMAQEALKEFDKAIKKWEEYK